MCGGGGDASGGGNSGDATSGGGGECRTCSMLCQNADALLQGQEMTLLMHNSFHFIQH